MGILFFLLAVLSLVLLAVGLIKPSLVLRWGKRTRRNVFISYSVFFIIFTISFVVSIIVKEADYNYSGTTKVGELQSGVSTQGSHAKTKPQPQINPNNTKQQWAIMNVNMGSNIDLGTLITKLGDAQSIQITRYNPSIIKAYFFPEADMTIFLNTYSHEVSHWRIGRASE